MSKCMWRLSRTQATDTCPLCKRLYAAHTLAYTLYVANTAVVYVTCNPPPQRAHKWSPFTEKGDLYDHP